MDRMTENCLRPAARMAARATIGDMIDDLSGLFLKVEVTERVEFVYRGVECSVNRKCVELDLLKRSED